MTDELCVSCSNPIRKADEAFAQDQQTHPGVLGLIHQNCYEKEVDVRPETPWEDPISGEIDYEGMAEDLGVSDGSEEGEEMDGYATL